MEYEWDEAKRFANIEKHNLDFLDADLVFDNDHLVGAAKTVNGEARRILIGVLGGVHVAVVFTERLGVIRVISMRRARHAERERHQAIFGG